jgi:hypothetical protein
MENEPKVVLSGWKTWYCEHCHLFIAGEHPMGTEYDDATPSEHEQINKMRTESVEKWIKCPNRGLKFPAGEIH